MQTHERPWRVSADGWLKLQNIADAAQMRAPQQAPASLPTEVRDLLRILADTTDSRAVYDRCNEWLGGRS